MRRRRAPGKRKAGSGRERFRIRRCVRVLLTGREADCARAGTGQPYTAGYRRGYRDGWKAALPARGQGYDEGFDHGFYAGGDGIVDRLLPEDVMLPDVSIHEIIAAGLTFHAPAARRLMTAFETARRIREALEQGRPISVIRLGEAALSAMEQEAGTEALPQSDGTVPGRGRRLAEAVRKASIVGIPVTRHPRFLPRALSVLEQYGIDYRKLQLTHSYIHHSMYRERLMHALLRGRRVLLTGSGAGLLAKVFMSIGLDPVRVIDIPEGESGERLLQVLAGQRFEIALVSGGLPSILLTEKIASELGKAAIDFGRLADFLWAGDRGRSPDWL